MTTPTYSDDFTSDGWTDADSSYIGVNTGNENFDIKSNNTDGSNDASAWDNGSTINDTKWIVDFDWNFTSWSGNNRGSVFIGFSNTDEGVGRTGTQDFLGCIFDNGTGKISSSDQDNGNNPLKDTTGSTLSTGTTYYMRMIRLSSTTYKVDRYSNSARTTLTESISGTCAATVDSLRYFKVMNQMEAGGGGASVSTINNFKFWNGINEFVDEQQVKVWFYPDNNVQNIIDEQQVKVWFYPDNNVQTKDQQVKVWFYPNSNVNPPETAWKWWLGMRYGTRKRYGTSHVRRMRV
jgi:hypothetical protein